MVNLCSDDNSNFVGMQSMFGKYSINDGSMLDTSSNYATGNVSGTCQTLNLNPSLPEWISTITFMYTKQTLTN